MPSRRASFVRAGGRVLAAKIATNALQASLFVLVARSLGPSGRGNVSFLTVFAVLLVVLVGFGVLDAARSLLVDEADPVPLGEFVGVSVALVGAALLIAALVAPLVFPLGHVTVTLPRVASFAGYACLSLAAYLFAAAVSAYGRTGYSAALETAGALVQLSLGVYFWRAGNLTVTPVMFSLGAGVGLQALLTGWALSRSKQSWRPAWRVASFKRLLRRGSGSAVVGLSHTVTFSFDRVLLGALSGSSAFGLYAVAATSSEALRLLAISAGQVVTYRVASRQADRAWLGRVGLLTFGLIGLGAVTGAAAAGVLVPHLFGDGYRGAVTPFRILLVAEIGVCLYFVALSVLVGLGELSRAGRAAASAALVAVAAAIALVPAFGAAGAAWSSVIGYGALGLFTASAARSAWGRRRATS